ncbi:MAG TPA: hypothetical protein VGH33_14745, partial [Isosphaeraceae bacterium]
RAVAADLAMLIAATIPDPTDQESAGLRPPTEPPAWPWTGETLRSRLVEAQSALGLSPSRDLNPTQSPSAP